MEICLITGSHPRHKYLFEMLSLSQKISGWVIEQRENIIPTAPENIDINLAGLFNHHYEERNRIENLIFTSNKPDLKLPVLRVEKKELNSKVTVQFIKKLKPKLVISYGCHKLNNDFMVELNCRFWNIHGGITPDYRGVTTHFWPSYFLEPQMTGITLHETTNALDAGEIVFQSAAPLVRGDTLHRLASRNVEYFSQELSKKLSQLDYKNLPRGKVKSGYGKVFRAKDWRPEHLRLIYESYEDKIVDAVLDGKLIGRQPDLYSII